MSIKSNDSGRRGRKARIPTCWRPQAPWKRLAVHNRWSCCYIQDVHKIIYPLKAMIQVGEGVKQGSLLVGVLGLHANDYRFDTNDLVNINSVFVNTTSKYWNVSHFCFAYIWPLKRKYMQFFLYFLSIHPPTYLPLCPFILSSTYLHMYLPDVWYSLYKVDCCNW
jgi:hypothetical protein